MKLEEFERIEIDQCIAEIGRLKKALRLAERIINSVEGHPYLKEDLVMAMFVREYREGFCEAELEQP